jgi:hypothetical protein
VTLVLLLELGEAQTEAWARREEPSPRILHEMSYIASIGRSLNTLHIVTARGAVAGS